MLNPKHMRTDPETVFKCLARRGGDFNLKKYLQLEAQRKSLQVEVEDHQAQLKQQSKEIGKLKAAQQDTTDLLTEVEKVKSALKAKEEVFVDLQNQLQQFLLELPNTPDDSVPDGKDESDNREVSTFGTPPQFDFPHLDHTEIGEKLGLLDFGVAATIAGARFSVAYAKLARLYRALGQFMLDLHTDHHGYREVYLPHIVNRESLIGTGQLPKFEEDLFHLSNTQYYLIPTAEVPLVNLYRGSIINAKDLPIKMVAYTSCFRSEAGAYGKDTRGLIRQHQFEKVELVQFTVPEDSARALEEIRSHAETVLQKLELAYRTVELCAGDLGFAATKTYDLEVWIPSEGCYREISSCSNTLDFQARRLKIRTRSHPDEKPQLLHTLNGSGLAVGRTLVAVIENYQSADGSIRVPEVLQAYMGGCKVIGSD